MQINVIRFYLISWGFKIVLFLILIIYTINFKPKHHIFAVVGLISYEYTSPNGIVFYNLKFCKLVNCLISSNLISLTLYELTSPNALI